MQYSDGNNQLFTTVRQPHSGARSYFKVGGSR